MCLFLFKLWLLLLTALDLMILIQLIARIVLFLAGRTREIDWSPYNRVMLSLLAVTFLPVTAAVRYLKN